MSETRVGDDKDRRKRSDICQTGEHFPMLQQAVTRSACRSFDKWRTSSDSDDDVLIVGVGILDLLLVGAHEAHAGDDAGGDLGELELEQQPVHHDLAPKRTLSPLAICPSVECPEALPSVQDLESLKFIILGQRRGLWNSSPFPTQKLSLARSCL